MNVFAAGALVGLAHLARADGPLLLIAIALIALLPTLHPPQSQRYPSPSFLRFTPYVLRFTFYVLRPFLPLTLGYLLIMLPWFLRNLQVAGTLLPAAGSQTIWLTDYDQLFSYGRTLSPQTLLGQGVGPLLAGRWWALTTNLQTVIAVWGMIFLTPLAVVGGWKLRRHLLWQLATLYGVLLFLALTFVFTFPGARGGLFHSGTALLPFVYAAAAIGLDQSILWMAARRQNWDVRLAQRFFAAGLVVMAITLSAFIYYQRVLRNNVWNRVDAHYPEVAAWVAQQDPQAVVMVGNPPAYRYHGGGLSVVVPNEEIELALQAADRYGVDYLILDQNRPLPLAEIYGQSASHPRLSLVKTIGGIHIYEIVSRSQ